MINLRISKTKTQAFLHACFHGESNTVNHLLDKKHWTYPDVNAESFKGLGLACEYGHLDIMEMIVQNERFQGSSVDVLSIALASENPDAILYILYRLPHKPEHVHVWKKHVEVLLQYPDMLKCCRPFLSKEDCVFFVMKTLTHQQLTALRYMYDEQWVDKDTFHKTILENTLFLHPEKDDMLRYICSLPGIQDEPTFIPRLEQLWYKYAHYRNAAALEYLSFSSDIIHHVSVDILDTEVAINDDASLLTRAFNEGDVLMATWCMKMLKSKDLMEYIQMLDTFKTFCRDHFFMEKFKEVEDFNPLWKNNVANEESGLIF